MHKEMQTITENIMKIHKIAYKNKNYFILNSLGVIRTGQKSRAHSCPSLSGNTKSFRAKIK